MLTISKTKAYKVLKQDKRTLLEWPSRGRRFDPDGLHKVSAGFHLESRRFLFKSGGKLGGLVQILVQIHAEMSTF